MSNGKASRRKDTADALRDINKQKRNFNAASRRTSSGTGPVSFGSVSSNFGVSVGSNNDIRLFNGLSVGGGVMMGPIAYNPQERTLASDVLTLTDITGIINPGSSWTIVSSQDSNADDLVTINGAAFSGQILYLQAKNQEITLKTTGNIHTNDNADVVLSAFNSGAGTGGEVATLIYDDRVTGGNWVVVNVGSGGGSSTWNGDATSILDMNNYEIQHTGKISFEVTSGVYPSIDVSADSSVMNFRVNGIGAMALSEASGDPTLEVIGNPNPAIKTRSTDSTPTDDQIIGGLYFDAFNSALSLKTFGSLKMESSDVTSGSEDGAFMMNLMKNGTGTNVLLFDNDRLLPQQTDTYDLGGNANRFQYVSAKYLNNIEQLSFSAAISGQYINSSTAGLQYYVPSGDSHVFEVVSTPVVTMTSTETTFADDVIVSGDLTNTTHNDNFTWSGTGYTALYSTNSYLYSDTTWLGQYGNGDVCRISSTLNFTGNTSGTHQTLPTQSDGYISIEIGGIARKLYYYN